MRLSLRVTLLAVVFSLTLTAKLLLASYTLFSVVDFGAGRSGLSTVGYKVYVQSTNTLGSRITTGVQEIGTTGKYGAVVTFADGLVGGVLWDSGETTAVYAMDVQNPQTGENLDAKVSSRSTYAGADTGGTTTLLARVTATRAGNLDNLDATVSSRSTYAGGDTSGTTTLLGRLTSTRAGLLDNLDAAVSSRSSHTAADVWTSTTRSLTDKAGFSLTQAFPTNFSSLAITSGGAITAGTVSDKTGYSLATAPPTVSQIAAQITTDHGSGSYTAATGDSSGVTTLLTRIPAVLTITSGKVDVNDKTGFSLTSAYDPAKVDIWNVTLPAGYTGQKAGNLLWRVGNKP